MEENVRIVITGDNRNALAKINQVQKAVERLNTVSQKVEVSVSGLKQTEREVNRLYQALERLENAALSKLPQSVQLLIAYLKAANSGMATLASRAALAAAGVGKIGRISFAPIVKSQSQAIKGFENMRGALVSLRLEFAKIFEIQQRLLRQQRDIGGFGGGAGRIGGGGGGGGKGGDFGRAAGALQEFNQAAGIFEVKVQDITDALRRANSVQYDRIQPDKSTALTTAGTFTRRPTFNLENLRRLQAGLQASFEAAQIGSKRFKQLEKALIRVNKTIEETERAARQAERGPKRSKLGAALVGGAFPLLFGQGPGAAIGGAIGEMFGPMGGIVGTAIGAPIDEFVGAAARLGQALNPLTADLDALTAAAGKANTVLSNQIKALEEAGLKNTALELATQQLANTVGEQGVDALSEFGDDAQKLGKVFAQAMSLMQSAVANVINSIGILKNIVQGLENFVTFEQAKRTKDSDPELQRLFEERKSARSSAALFNVTGARTRAEVDRDIIERRKKLNAQESANILNLTRLALTRKKNLEEAKRQLDAQQKLSTTTSTITGLINQQAQARKDQQNFEDRRNQIVLNFEKGVADLRRNVENQVSTLRLQNIRKANQLEDQRAKNALAQLRNLQKKGQFLIEGPGTANPFLAREAKILRDAADTYVLRMAEAQRKRTKIERDSALTVEEIEFRSTKFRLDVARQAGQLQLSAQRQIDSINKSIAERNAAFDATRFNNEVSIAQLRLSVLQKEIAFEKQKLNDALKTAEPEDAQGLQEQQRALKELSDALALEGNRLKNVTAPAPLTEVSGIAGANQDLTEYNRLAQESVAISKQFREAQLSGVEGQVLSDSLERLSANLNLLREIETQEALNTARRVQASEKEARIFELTRELGSRSRAEEIAGFEIAARLQQQKLDLIETDLLAQQALLQAKVDLNNASEEEVRNLERIADLLERINKARGAVTKNKDQNIAGAKGEIETFIEQATAELNNFEALAVRVSQGIGDAIGSSLNNGISQLIEGSTTVKEVFADMLKSIGQVLVQEGTKMIATYIAIGIARIFAGMGGGSTKGPDLNAIEQYSGIGANTPVSPLANGGPARAGQPYMVGERGPELFIPGSNGGVMRNEDMRQLMGRSPAASNAPQMNFSFETTNIGGQEFVSREQLEAAMATTRRQAANDGAKRGMSMTLDKMQNSPRTRSRIGIS